MQLDIAWLGHKNWQSNISLLRIKIYSLKLQNSHLFSDDCNVMIRCQSFQCIVVTVGVGGFHTESMYDYVTFREPKIHSGNTPRRSHEEIKYSCCLCRYVNKDSPFLAHLDVKQSLKDSLLQIMIEVIGRSRRCSPTPKNQNFLNFSLFTFFVFYRPPTKLREGNVFTRVCLSVHKGVPYDQYP